METEKMEEEISKNHSRKPWVAVILSLPAPGTGLIYCGRLFLGFLWLLFALVSVKAFYWISLYGPAWTLSYYLLLIIVILVPILSAIHAYIICRHLPKDYQLKSYNRWYSYPLYWILALIIVKLFVLQFGHYKLYTVSSASMANQLFVEEQILVDLSTYKKEAPMRYDVMALIWPGDNKTPYVERCIGLPGDKIQLKDKDVYINDTIEVPRETIMHSDKAIQNPPSDKPESNTRDNWGPYIVPKDCFFVLGDNRDNSYDSRYWGPLKRELLIGKVVRIISSPDNSRIGKYIK